MRSRWIDGREELGQRRRDGDDERLLDDEAHIGFDREFRRGQGAAARGHVVAREAERVGQHQPALDAAGFFAEAVVIVDAVNPFAAQFAIVHAAHEGGVLARHRLLIAVAVERPGGDLSLLQLAAVQQLMELVLVVIALGADGADRGFEFGARKRRGLSPIRHDLVHVKAPIRILTRRRERRRFKPVTWRLHWFAT